jgi:hypothetical protein
VARASQVIVLAEDERHQRFAYRYLQQLNYTAHSVRFEDLPSGQGSGEAWVRTRYAPAVKAYRARAARAQTALVVAIDADPEDVVRRTRQLEDGPAAEGLFPRTSRERIVHLIPKRNIETWILNLNGHLVDEDTDFSRDVRVEDLIVPAANTLFDWTRANAVIPPYCVPSLRTAIIEIQRLEYD